MAVRGHPLRAVSATDEMRLSLGDTGALSFLPIGFHFFSAEATRFRVSMTGWHFGRPEFRRAHFFEIGPYVLACTPGGREELRRVVDPEFADLVDQLEPKDLPAVWSGPDVPSTLGVGVSHRATPGPCTEDATLDDQ